jgi:single-stranded-DNA-specific exonuclease
MQKISKKWVIQPILTPQANEILAEYPKILRQILFNRGISSVEEAKNFLGASKINHDPFLLTGVAEGITRIKLALENKEMIAIYGDYDADGITSSALMFQTLKSLKAKVEIYIPDRFTEGYGLNIDAIKRLKDKGNTLIITVDCGIRAIEQANYCNENEIDLIITDHHTCGDKLPDSLVLINPKQPNDKYPEKFLAGVGVAYKLACGLLDSINGAELEKELLLDLVAIGTIADLVPLEGENRSMVRDGLSVIRQSQRNGLLSLIGVAGININTLGASDIGFSLGPRLNAAGRLASAHHAVDLLLEEDRFQAGLIAQTLDNINRDRQEKTRVVQEDSEKLALLDGLENFLLFAVDENFNSGVVGLAASRLVEKYYLPSFVGHRGEEFTRASGRSIPEFHITTALEECKDILEQYGGHAAAAGFTVSNQNLGKLKERLQKIAKRELVGINLQPSQYIDVEVNLKDLNIELLKTLNNLQPTGYGNPEPVFFSREIKVLSARVVGRDKTHLKLTVNQDGTTFDAIAFRLGHLFVNLPHTIDIAFLFEINEFNGKRNFQLNIKEIRESE